MVLCFVYGCSHRTKRDKCALYRFPTESGKLKKWERLCRREDRAVEPSMDRICSCHFVDGCRDNTPSLFPWNTDKLFLVEDPPVVKSRKCKRSKPDSAFSVTTEKRPPEDHPYAHRCLSESCTTAHQRMESAYRELEGQMLELRVRTEDLKKKLERKRPMCIKDIMGNPEKMLLYTSIPYDIFSILINCLQRFNLNYYNGWTVKSIPLEDQLLITLMKLKLNLRSLDLAERFGTSRATISNIVTTFICALHELLFVGMLNNNLPSQMKCKGSMPKTFDEFVGARVVMDATEIMQDIPYSLDKQSACYSSYKSRHTLKALTCVAPNGAIVYCSDLYPGATSDTAVVEHCRILDKMVPGDLILADKGFPIYKLLPSGVSLNIPPFLTGKSQFTAAEAKMCSTIAKARIHVERGNERIKNFSILNHIPCHLRPLSSKIFQVCCCIVNLQAPLLSEIAEKHSSSTVSP